MKSIAKIILILIIQYFILSIALIFFEIQTIKNKAMDVTNVVRTASYNALRQTQMMDDFMTYRGEDYYKLKMPTVDGEFVEVDTVQAIFDIHAETEEDMKTVYEALYDNEEFRSVLTLSKPMRVPIMYYDRPLETLSEYGGFPELEWYSAPLSIMLGLDNQETTDPDIETIGGAGIDGQLSSEIVDMYRFKDVYKKIVTNIGKFEDDSEYTYFFNTPLNTGITYLNRDLLTSLFVNNIDLLMRAPYRDSTNKSTNTVCAQNDTEIKHQTVVCGNTYVDLIEHEDKIQPVNPVNNGVFTFLRGEEITSGSAGKAYKGTKKVEIDYKIIDMHNPANNALLRTIFGSDTGTGSVGGSKADYFKKLNTEKYSLFGANFNSLYKEYPFIVAKVTFYADFIVPYTTPIARVLSSEWGTNAVGTFLHLEDDTNVDYGAKRVSHTTFFAVVP